MIGLLTTFAIASAAAIETPGVELAELTWLEAEPLLTEDAVVVIPLGAAAKEHGPHLRLDNDFQLAEYLKARVIGQSDAIVAPTINYHHYPAFQEYPGSTYLSFETSTAIVVDIVRSLAAYGPKRFYVVNTGVSTMRPLSAAAEALEADGVRLEFTNIIEATPSVEEISEQAGGSHADEIETSAMLYIDRSLVEFDKAVDDYYPRGTDGLVAPRRIGGEKGVYSASGVWGQPTLASADKGQIIIEELVQTILDDIERLRRTPLGTEQ